MTTQPSLQRLTPDEQELSLLLSLAYLGQLTLDQLARLTQCSARTLQRRLTQDADSLVKRAWVERVDRAAFDDQLGIPNRVVMQM